jgi:hypothetical protein
MAACPVSRAGTFVLPAICCAFFVPICCLSRRIAFPTLSSVA